MHWYKFISENILSVALYDGRKAEHFVSSNIKLYFIGIFVEDATKSVLLK